MSRLTIIIFILLSNACFGQKTIEAGIGILQVDFEKISTLNFFEKITDLKPSKNITVFKVGEYDHDLKNRSEAEKWFDPETLWFEYYIFNLRVIDKNGKWLNVVVNNQTGETMWIKTVTGLNFVTWEKFLLNTTAISGNQNFVIEVKTKPNDESKTLRKLGQKECLESIEIKGDWMRVKTNEILDCDDSGKIQEQGWIKWRQNNYLAIEYDLTC
jgi:hypothetical protein